MSHKLCHLEIEYKHIQGRFRTPFMDQVLVEHNFQPLVEFSPNALYSALIGHAKIHFFGYFIHTN